MSQTREKKLNPDVPPFIPKSLISIRSYQKNPKQHDGELMESGKSSSSNDGPSKLSVSAKAFVVQDNDFPSILSDTQPLIEPIWSRAGFRSFKDVAASTSTVKRECSVERMEGSHESGVKARKKKKKKKLKEEAAESDLQNKGKPKSKGITLDQIVVAKIVEEATKKKKESVVHRSKKLVVRSKKKSSETPRNQLDSTAPKQRKGKTREVPKKKKPTKMKKFIIMEKELRKKNLAASKEFKRKNLERAVDVVIRSVDISHLNVSCMKEIGSGDHIKSSEQKDEKVDDLVNSLSSLSLEQKVSQLVHSNDYREYCNQCLSDEIDQEASNLLIEMVRLQDRMHAKDPQKAKIKRRYCCGLKEVDKYLTIQKVKCLLIAPDIQQIVKDGVLDKSVQNLIGKCGESQTPIVFCLTRSQLGYLCKKRAKISCVAILNPSGADEVFKSLIKISIESCHEYEELRGEITKIIAEKEKGEKGDTRSKEIEELRMRMKRQTLFWRKKRKSN